MPFAGRQSYGRAVEKIGKVEGLRDPTSQARGSVETSDGLELVARGRKEKLRLGAVQDGAHEVGPLTGIELVHRFTVDQDRAPDVRRAVPGKKTGESRDQSGLAGARTPANSRDLAGYQAQTDIPQELPAPAGESNGEFPRL